MEPLAGPFELLEMSDGEVRELRVLSWEAGTMRITPQDGRGPKEITALRCHVAPADKLAFPFYWDLTASTLVAQLLPALEAAGAAQVVVQVIKYGVAPRARFGVRIRAVEEATP